jgi:hypothetical protein
MGLLVLANAETSLILEACAELDRAEAWMRDAQTVITAARQIPKDDSLDALDNLVDALARFDANHKPAAPGRKHDPDIGAGRSRKVTTGETGAAE